MTVEPLSDAELLRLMLAGDEEAFTGIYRRHQARIYRFAVQMCGERAIAEDVVQETFLTLMREGAKYDPTISPLAAFLYGIARNHLKRRFAREHRFVALEHDEPNIEKSPLNLNALDDPLERLTRTETIEQVRRAILSLPEHYRETIALCELHEMSYEEAARVLECPIGTVRSRLNRARALLLARLCESDTDMAERNEKWIAKSLN